MSCCDARSLLPLLLDGQLAADQRVAAIEKVNACRLCRAELSALAAGDAMLGRALAAQTTAAIPAGYFDDFWSRVEANLDVVTSEGDAMRMSSGTGDKPVEKSALATPPNDGQDVVGKPLSSDEVSGLHEIKELAASTIRRHSGQIRAATEPGAPSSSAQMLVSSAGLGNVALPDAGRESKAPAAVRATSVTDADGVPALSMPAPVAASAAPAKRSKAGFYVGAIGVLAAAAAGGLFLMKGQEGSPSAAAGPGTELAAATRVNEAADEARPETPPAQGAPVVGAVADPGAGNAATADPGEAADGEDLGQEVVGGTPGASSGKDGKDGKDARDAKSRGDKTAGDKTAGDKTAGDKTAGDKTAGDKTAGGARPKESAKPGAPGGGLAGVVTPAKDPAKPADEFDAVFGDKPKEEQKPEVAGPALPEKLKQDDVKKGMGSVKARVQSCYDKHKVPGTIKLRVKIDADGSVSSVDVTDNKFKGTETGACVAAAVGTAKFPAVTGPALVVSYPFILQ